jgi:phage FluMu protein Com
MKINDKFYRELRCKNCRKLICYEYVYAGRIAHTCSRCEELTEFTFKHFLGSKDFKNYQIGKGGEK